MKVEMSMPATTAVTTSIDTSAATAASSAGLSEVASTLASTTTTDPVTKVENKGFFSQISEKVGNLINRICKWIESGVSTLVGFFKKSPATTEEAGVTAPVTTSVDTTPAEPIDAMRVYLGALKSGLHPSILRNTFAVLSAEEQELVYHEVWVQDGSRPDAGQHFGSMYVAANPNGELLIKAVEAIYAGTAAPITTATTAETTAATTVV